MTDFHLKPPSETKPVDLKSELKDVVNAKKKARKELLEWVYEQRRKVMKKR